MADDFIVNGLPLPPLLISLIQQGKWRYPGAALMNEVMPKAVGRVDLPIEFYSLKTIRSETASHLRYFKDDDEVVHLFRETAATLGIPWMDELFHMLRGSVSTTSIELPWLDIEKSVFIAGSEVIGDDIEIALDYRTKEEDPRVVAPAWGVWGAQGCLWTEVTPTFSEFVERLGLT